MNIVKDSKAIGKVTLTFTSLIVILFIAVIAVDLIMSSRIDGCQTCYYCKTCTIGIGKLPELFFKKAGTANVNKRALKLFPFTYLLLSALPIALTIISLFQQATIYKAELLAGILLFSICAGVTRWRTLLNIAPNFPRQFLKE